VTQGRSGAGFALEAARAFLIIGEVIGRELTSSVDMAFSSNL